MNICLLFIFWRSPNGQEAEKTKDSILDAFYQLICRKNLEQININDIINIADIGRSTFYLHFKTKEDLVKATYTSYFSDLLASLQSDDLYNTYYSTINYNLLFNIAESFIFVGKYGIFRELRNKSASRIKDELVYRLKDVCVFTFRFCLLGLQSGCTNLHLCLNHIG